MLSEWENGLQQIEIVDFKTDERHRVSVPRAGLLRRPRAQLANSTPATLRYNYQSLVTPNSVFDYDMNTAQATLLKQTEVPGGFDRTNYQSERVFATASDGTKIPMSMVYRKGVKLRRLGAAAALRLRLVRRIRFRRRSRRVGWRCSIAA